MDDKADLAPPDTKAGNVGTSPIAVTPIPDNKPVPSSTDVAAPAPQQVVPAAVPAPAPALPAGAKPPRAIWSAIGIRLFIFLLAGGLVFELTRQWDWGIGSLVQQSTDNAYLQSDLTPISAKVPGYVRQVAVRD